MTEDEAIKVAKVIVHADGGCQVCTDALAEKMTMAFPKFDWLLLVTQHRDDETYLEPP